MCISDMNSLTKKVVWVVQQNASTMRRSKMALSHSCHSVFIFNWIITMHQPNVSDAYTQRYTFCTSIRQACAVFWYFFSLFYTWSREISFSKVQDVRLQNTGRNAEPRWKVKFHAVIRRCARVILLYKWCKTTRSGFRVESMVACPCHGNPNPVSDVRQMLSRVTKNGHRHVW